MLDADTLTRCMRAAVDESGATVADFGLDDTPEIRDAIEGIRSELGGMVAEIPAEFPDAGGTDHLYSQSAEEWADAIFGDDDGIPESVEEVGFSKSVGEAMFTLGPMYIPDSVDAHNEWTSAEELQKAVWKYSATADREIRLQHNRDVVAGRWSEIVTWPYEVDVPMHKADGSVTTQHFPANTVFLGVHWEPWAWALVKAGRLRGYSVGGTAKRIEVDLDTAA